MVVVVDVFPNNSDMSMDCAPCCRSISSIEIGVVGGDGQPVNSVVALKIYYFEKITDS